MKLADLKPAVPQKDRKRLGRGIGSGQGKTAGRGYNGQKSKTTVKPGFEGGQTPLHRRLPHMRGFRNRFKTIYAIVNLEQLEEKFEAGAVIDPDVLLELGIISKKEDGLKILAEGDVSKALTIRAHKFSKAAEEKIKAAGGSAEVLQ